MTGTYVPDRLYQLAMPTSSATGSATSDKHSDMETEFRVIETQVGRYVYVADQSRLYQLQGDAHYSPDQLREALSLLVPIDAQRAIGLETVPVPALRSLSLNVAQACNMGCSYCYADEGRFGGKPRLMSEQVAYRAVDQLLAEATGKDPVIVGFMGGEPMLHRSLVHSATRYAAARAAPREVRFSLTTNGTLIEQRDAELFREFPFSVQISIDGDRKTNDLARPMLSGGSSYDRIVKSLELMREHGRPNQLSARVTVTPWSRDLTAIFKHLVALGFDDVGFAPVLVSPNPSAAFSSGDFERFLVEMIECGRFALEEFKSGRRLLFSNLSTALDQLHLGTHRPYPCGAGAAYLSVNAEGELYACHRLIDDKGFAMGDVDSGLNHQSRRQLLERMHVDRMEPCRTCWARYLCGGGCYHEVTRRGRIGCDYIRGWIEFCISAYAELMQRDHLDKTSATHSVCRTD